ncbi:uncharacterized protein FIBRA_09161 [Fibroporia radiculosa]|uniref:Uncharacterized protein n=1 Tax=Fibroporia radiculosa TaxID=599839 RepID=J4GY22_9APHY|nr:uncharacterized protein FIBRA_09161 [Fibroporia radiculosa]CCM06855.1 predicted protein [Fibroporia radiculosa]
MPQSMGHVAYPTHWFAKAGYSYIRDAMHTICGDGYQDLSMENRRQCLMTEGSKRCAFRQIQSMINTLSPVAVLPREVLEHVFLHYIADAVNVTILPILANSILAVEDVEMRARQARAAVTLSGVCRYWRDIALDYSIFWTNVVINAYPMWVELQVERTKQAPFTLTLTNYFEEDRFLYQRMIGGVLRKILSKEMSRIRGIYIGIRVYEDIHAVLNSPAPLLESMAFMSGHDRDLPLPDIFCPKYATHLNRLQLQRCTLAWTKITSNSLRHLEIRSPLGLSCIDLLSVLEGLPLLESLNLYHATQRDHEEDAPAQQVELLSLKCLLIKAGDALECTRFLRRIIVPRLSVLCMHASDGDLVTLASLLTTKLPADASLDIVQHSAYLYVAYGLDSPTFMKAAIGMNEDAAVCAWMKTMASLEGGFVGVKRRYDRIRWVALDAQQLLHPKVITQLRVYSYKDLDRLLSTLAHYPTCIPSLRILELNYSHCSFDSWMPLILNKVNIIESLKRCIAKRTKTLEELRLVGCSFLTMCDIDDMKRLVKSVRVVQ